MNITWYWGNSSANATHYLGSTLNVANGTYSMAIPGASVVSTYYWWRVNVSDFLSNYVNESLRFRTSTNATGEILILNVAHNNLILGIVMGTVFSIPFGLIFFNRRRKKDV
jgi:hypothetical protein